MYCKEEYIQLSLTNTKVIFTDGPPNSIPSQETICSLFYIKGQFIRFYLTMKRQLKIQFSNNHSFTMQQDTRIGNQLQPAGSINLHHYLSKLHIPRSLQKTVASTIQSLESRIWLMDNSTFMQEQDGCLIRMDQRLESIQMGEDVSRWSEQVQVAEFHMKMAARCCIPTKVSAVVDDVHSSAVSCI